MAARKEFIIYLGRDVSREEKEQEVKGHQREHYAKQLEVLRNLVGYITVTVLPFLLHRSKEDVSLELQQKKRTSREGRMKNLPSHLFQFVNFVSPWPIQVVNFVLSRLFQVVNFVSSRLFQVRNISLDYPFNVFKIDIIGQ